MYVLYICPLIFDISGTLTTENFQFSNRNRVLNSSQLHKKNFDSGRFGEFFNQCVGHKLKSLYSFLYFNNINKEITSISWTWSSIMFCWCLMVPSSSLFRSKSVLPSSAASCKSVKNKIEHLNHVEFNTRFHFKLSILKAI